MRLGQFFQAIDNGVSSYVMLLIGNVSEYMLVLGSEMQIWFVVLFSRLRSELFCHCHCMDLFHNLKFRDAPVVISVTDCRKIKTDTVSVG